MNGRKPLHVGRLFNFLGEFHGNALVGCDCRRSLFSGSLMRSRVGIPCHSAALQREGLQAGHEDAGDPAAAE